MTAADLILLDQLVVCGNGSGVVALSMVQLCLQQCFAWCIRKVAGKDVQGILQFVEPVHGIGLQQAQGLLVLVVWQQHLLCRVAASGVPAQTGSCCFWCC